MSSVIVQVGQCGNQIGSNFWKFVANSRTKASGGHNSNAYVQPDGADIKFRSVNVDSEPKVIRRLANEKFAGDVSFRKSNLALSRRGRGNNWALGYYGTNDSIEDAILERSIEAIRKESERCDYLSGIIMFHSISGGTGSGLGSRLCEVIRDDFSTHHMINCTVAPHCGGESPLQHYNSLLCLSHIQRCSDSILFFQNDDILSRLLKRRNGDSDSEEEQKSISFQQMNAHIAICLAGVFFPTDTLTHSRLSSIGSEPYEMLRALCPMPSLKFVSDINHTSIKKQSWENLTQHILRSRQKRDEKGIKFKSMSSLVIARGDTTRSFPASMKNIESRIKSGYNTVSWNPFPVDFWMAKESLSQSSSLTVAANTSAIVPYLEHTLDRCWQKYSAKAFLHWYKKYGCLEEEFEEAFSNLQSVVCDYKDAIK